MAKNMQAKHKLHKPAANMVIMAEHQAAEKGFDALFAQGMALVDKVSCYFSHISAKEAECESVTLASFYEQDRKRLGAVAMQMAAWLWLERALREGDMSAKSVAAEKKKLVFTPKTSVFKKNSALTAANDAVAQNNQTEDLGTEVQNYEKYFASLPKGYRQLAVEVENFVNRIQYMDKAAQPTSAAKRYKAPNAIASQWDRLHRAFLNKK